MPGKKRRYHTWGLDILVRTIYTRPHNIMSKHKIRIDGDFIFGLISTVDFAVGCKNISDVAFVECQSINNEAISKLEILKDNLINLKINGCSNVSDKGILTLTNIP